MRRSGILVALLALPLYVPVLVFSAGSVAASAQGLDPAGGLLYLAAGLVLALVLAPMATAAAVRIAHACGRTRRVIGQDRKSVVWGNSVSVSDVFGGSRS